MSIKKQVKKLAHGGRKISRGIYRLLYAKPYRFYMKNLCPTISAVNILNSSESKPYQALSFFPTLIYDSKKEFKNVYKTICRFDDNGIPNAWFNGEYRYIPITIAQHGLCLYNFYLHSSNEKFLHRAENVGIWLVENQNRESGAWEYHYDFYLSHVSEWMRAPFCSAMGQGEGIALLSRLYQSTGKAEYYEVAKRAILPFYKTAENHGVLTYIGDNLPFYEEFPAPKQVLILNGFMFSLIGLYDLTVIRNDSEVKKLFDNGYETLIKILPLYDNGITSLYCLNHLTAAPRNPSINEYYHPIHIQLLQALNIIQKSEVLEYYISLWK